MTGIALLLASIAIQAHPASADMANATRQAGQIGEPPIAFSVDGVGAERTIAEFMDVCFRPMWDVAAVREAVEKSGFEYDEQHEEDYPESFRWRSKRAVLALETRPPMFSQCALSIASIQPRTGEQLLAMLKPAVEIELGFAVREDDEHFRLEWTDPVSGNFERIELKGAGDEPQQAIWFVFDKTAPGVREKLDALGKAMTKEGTLRP